MQIRLDSVQDEFMEGLSVIVDLLNMAVAADGLRIFVEKNTSNALEISRRGNRAVIRYGEKVHVFRAVGLIKEHWADGDFDIREEPQFRTNSLFLDMAQSNAALKTGTVRQFMAYAGVMGINSLMLYMEDNFEVKEWPYFGYMRGKYSFREMKEIDDFGFSLGIEVIPCIQTLGHLNDALRWTAFDDIAETTHHLLVGEEKTYRFIEDMIRAASAPFRSRRMLIGMDEAWGLGRGKYLDKHGYRESKDIMREHLARVNDICLRYDVEPMIFSDMFFKSSEVYGLPYAADTGISRETVECVPGNVRLIYWEYFIEREEYHRTLIRQHRAFGRPPVVAGAVLGFASMAPNYGKTMLQTEALLRACKEEGVEEVINCIWGTNGCENNYFSAMLGIQLFAEHGYVAHPDEERLKARFKACTGANYDDFMDMRFIDETPGTKPGNREFLNPSYYMLWQNILLGTFDKNLESLDFGTHYRSLAATMARHKTGNARFGFIFELYEKLCRVLELKATLGLDIAGAYRAGDKDALARYAKEVLPELYRRVDDLRTFHRSLWHRQNQPYGWEILDLKYSAVMAGADTARYRLAEYVEGRVERIEELEDERLSFYHDVGEGLVFCCEYVKACSPSHLSLLQDFSWREIKYY